MSALNGDEAEEESTQDESENTSSATSPVKAGPSLVVLLQERLKMYQEAEINAKKAGETSRARR